MKKNKCDKCVLNGHCAFQKQVPKGLTVGSCDWFIPEGLKTIFFGVKFTNTVKERK